MSNEKLFYVGVKALIENEENKILLLKADVTTHRKNTETYWDIPGGRIEEGQGIEEALRREVQEETGIDKIVESEFFTAVISNHEIPLDDKTLGLVLMVYKVKIPAGSKIYLSHEHIEYDWADNKEAAKRLSHKYPPEFTNRL
jgi:8-oxo-dGTP diphosphatase